MSTAHLCWKCVALLNFTHIKNFCLWEWWHLCEHSPVNQQQWGQKSWEGICCHIISVHLHSANPCAIKHFTGTGKSYIFSEVLCLLGIAEASNRCGVGSSQHRSVLSYFSLLLRKVSGSKNPALVIWALYHVMNLNVLKIRLQLARLHTQSCCVLLFWSLSWEKKWYNKTWPSALSF